MIEIAVTSSVLILVIIALRYLFRWKISRRLQYALWGLVLLRLFMPFSLFGSQFSIMNVFDTTGINEVSAETRVTTDINSSTDMLPAEAQAAGNGVLHEIQGGTVVNGNSSLNNAVFTAAREGVPGRILGVVWLVGSIAAGLWFLGSNLVFYRKLRKTRKIFSTGDCRLPVYTAEGLASPCLFGILRPAIYLTPKAADTVESTRYVHAHEQCHYRHGDHIWAMMRGLCLAVWWWNPFVWLAAMLSRTDGEMACDESVIRQFGEDSRLIYGRTLIDMIAIKREHSGLMCAATAMSSGKRSMKLRLNMIIKKPKTFIPALIAVVLIVAVSTGCTFTGAKDSPVPSKGNGAVSAYAQELYDSRNAYIGDPSADGALLNALGISDKLSSYTLELDTQQEPYNLRLIFSKEITDAVMLNRVMNENAMLLLALIDNVSEIQWQYTYIDNSAGGSGEFTGALTKEDATAVLNDKDIKDYGKSAAEVQALLDWLNTENDAVIDYTLVKLGKNGDVLDGVGALAGDDIKLIEDIINSYLFKSAAWNDVDIKALDESYLLSARHFDGTITDYYAFEKDGSAFLQMGLGGQYSRIDDGLYGNLVKRANGGTSSTEVTGNVGEKIDRTNLEACISEAILSANVKHFPNGDFAAEAHTSLGLEERGKTTTVYAMALYMVFGYAGSGFSEIGGNHMPVAITFEKNNAGEYVLKEYWIPKDGSQYGPSIKEKFPTAIHEDALDTQKYILGHTRNCYAQAIEYGNVPVAGHLEKLIETICASPGLSSNPGDYIDAHPIEYREVLYFSRYTLDYCFDLFEQGGQTGLEGHIMALACKDILGEEGEVDVLTATGQDWYDAFKKSAQT